jgi:ElaB/YqjD/DUF883 family membrane-anchored ribosome-binding protein
MDDTSRRVDADDSDKRTREIRNEIEETRDELSETVDAIQEKLKPRNIAASAAERVKTATTERVRDMADTASETAQQAMEYTREATGVAVEKAKQNPVPLALLVAGAGWWLARRSSSKKTLSSRYRGQPYYEYEGYVTEAPSEYDDDGGLMARIRNNPIPATIAGVGITWLACAGLERESGYGSGDTGQGLTDRASEMASRTREYASDTAESMRRMARRRQNQVQRVVNNNPVLVGAAALFLGAAFGLAVPETETENELMGEARENVVGRARDAARDAANEVQEAASTVVDAAKTLVGKSQS